MPKHVHEIRDPIHVFVRLDSDERRVLDSAPFQRLRHIHQLATTYLVYPGATHRRFEHSLGVMELAGRVFDVVTQARDVDNQVGRLLPELSQPNQLAYWKRVLRMAALCHDVGHLPFSHAAEQELLPQGWDHERITREIIVNGPLREVFDSMTPPLRPLDVAKLAVGPKKAVDLRFSAWEEILAEIIVGDAFGVDRMDYLLRDSHHAGVAYGRFDHYRLVDTLRILPSAPLPAKEGSENAPQGDGGEPKIPAATGVAPAAAGAAPPPSKPPRASQTREPALGIEEGGLHSAEALMLARFFMYSQLYFHPVRRIYDIHLKDFLKDWLGGGQFSTDVAGHLAVTDNEVTAALLQAARSTDSPGHDAARRLTERGHFRLLYQRHPDDVAINANAGEAVFNAARHQFGADRVRRDRYSQRTGAPEFPVVTKDGRISSSLAMSQTLSRLEAVSVDFVFVDPAILIDAQEWLDQNRESIITPTEAPDHG